MQKEMKQIFKNWKTTAIGIATIVSGIVLIAQGNNPAGMTAVTTGIGLIFAKDAEQV